MYILKSYFLQVSFKGLEASTDNLVSFSPDSGKSTSKRLSGMHSRETKVGLAFGKDPIIRTQKDPGF